MADGPDDAARTDWGQHHICPSEDDGEEDEGGGGGRPPRRFLVYPGSSSPFNHCTGSGPTPGARKRTDDGAKTGTSQHRLHPHVFELMWRRPWPVEE